MSRNIDLSKITTEPDTPTRPTPARSRMETARTGGDREGAKKYNTAWQVQAILSQQHTVPDYNPNANQKFEAPSYQASSPNIQKLVSGIDSDINRDINSEQKKRAGAWNTYSRGVNELLASANRGIGNTASMFGSALTYLGAKGTDTGSKLGSGGGLWKAYSKAGEWLSGAGEGMTTALQTERSKEIDRIFNEDPVAALAYGDFWLTKAPEQLVPSLALMIPGVGVTGAVAKTAMLAKYPLFVQYAVGSLAGAGVMRPIEGLSEAGDTYEAAKAKGMTEAEAVSAGAEVYRGNMNLIGLDAFQLAVAATPIGKIAAGTKTIWGRIVVEALEMAAAGATEGGEEVYQSYISKKALGEEFDIFGTESQQSFILGMIGGLVFQAAGKAMTPREEREAADDYTERMIDALPEGTRDEIRRAVNEAVGDTQSEATEDGPGPELDAKMDALEALAAENPAAIETAARAVDSQFQQDVQSDRTAAEQEAALEEFNNQREEDQGDMTDITADIDRAVAMVQGNQTPTNDNTFEGVENMTPEQITEAQDIFERDYADEYRQVQEEQAALQEKAKTAKGTEATNLQDQIEKSADRQSEIESDFLATVSPNARKEDPNQAKNIVDDVQQETRFTPSKKELAEDVQEYDKVRYPKLSDGEAAMNSVNPVLFGLAKEAPTFDQFVEDVQKSKAKSAQGFSRTDLLDWWNKLDNTSDKQQNNDNESDNDTKRDIRRREDSESGSVSEPGSTVPGESNTESSDEVARGKREQRSSEPGKRSSNGVELGTKAFEAGKERIPMRDADFVKTLKDKPGTSRKLMEDWYEGWDTANLAEPQERSIESVVADFFAQAGNPPTATDYISGSDEAGYTYDEALAITKAVADIPMGRDNKRYSATITKRTDGRFKIKNTMRQITVRKASIGMDAEGVYTHNTTARINEKQKSKLGKAVTKMFKNNFEDLENESTYFQVKREGYMTLNIERISDNRLAMSHVYTQNGDIMRDPEVVFEIDNDGQLVAQTIEHPPMVLNGRELSGAVPIKAKDSFLSLWADNLKAQGFLDVQSAPSIEVAQEEVPKTVERAEVEALERDMRSMYLALGESDVEGYSKAEEVLSEILVELELAEPGYRFPVGDSGQWDGVPSKFPAWIPDNARTSDDVKYALDTFDDVRSFSYPKKTTETKRRLLADALFEQLDVQLSIRIGSDFSTADLRKQIIDIYENATIIEPPKKSETKDANGDARGEEATENEGGNAEQSIEELAADALAPVTKHKNDLGIDVFEVDLTKEPSEAEVKEAADFVPAGGRERDGAEGRGLLDQYWTPPEAVKMTYDILRKLGLNLEGKNVVEPAAGVGNFLEGVPSSANVIAFEIDTDASQALKTKRSDIAVLNQPFERLFMDETGKKLPYKSETDLVVGNPPYGKHRGLFKGLGEESKISKYENYFIKRSLDITKEGGYVAMVVPSAFLRNGNTETGKKAIAELGELVAAMRLPNGAFDTTDIGTDILVFQKKAIKDMKSQSGMAIFASRMRTTSDDMYFRSNMNHVLGDEGMRSGRFGQEAFVDGSLEAAIELFNTTDFAALPSNSAIVSETYVDLDTQTEIETNGKEVKEPVDSSEKLKTLTDENLHKEMQKTETLEPVDEQSRRIEQEGADIKKETREAKRPKREYEPVPKGKLDLRTFTDVDAYDNGQWEYVQPTGELAGDFNADTAFYMDGKYYNEFNYVQGNIYARLNTLEADKSELTPEKYEKQKAMLEAVIPERMTVDRMRISPHTRFAEVTMLANMSLQQRFLGWIKDLPQSAFGDSSQYDVRGYTNGTPVRGSDKLKNEQDRRTRRTVGDELFSKFLKDELTPEQQSEVEQKYNTAFNGYYKPDYRQVPLRAIVSSTFKGKPLDIREVQQYGVGFLMNRGVGLLAHDVGLGKTMQGIVANLEMLERGWAKKPLIVLPNINVYKQWITEIQEISPDIKINELANLGGDFKGDYATLEIEEGTLSLVTEEGFKMLRFKDETYNTATALFNDVIEQPDAAKTKRQREVDKAAGEETVGKMMRGTDNDRYFEDLGFDALTIDEIHNANHIIGKAKPKDEDAKTTEFRGFQLKPSQYGLKTWLAAQYIQEKNNGRNVIGLSATPFTNHPLEYYSVLSLFARKTMEDMGILNVNDFMSMFMDVTSQLEFKANGDYSEKTEVRNFKNYQQFQQLLTQFIDFRDGKDAGIVRPDRQTREFRVPENQDQYDFKAAAQPLFNDKKGGGVLKGIGELRAIAFSPYLSRFYRGPTPTAKQFVEGSPKIKLTMELVKQTLKDVKDSGQLIYSTLGVEYFPYIEKYLIEEVGLKADQVKIISGKTPKKNRSKIQADFNAGKVKVIIGSDAIQEGVNLQERTTDIYMLSQPWNFTAVRQVIGRAWRQGNKWRNVRVNQMFTENSVDIFMAQKLKNKEKRYEESIKAGDDVVEIGDIDYTELMQNLLTDPVHRTKLEYQMKEQEIGIEISRLESEFAYSNRKNEQYIKAWEDVRKAKERYAENPDWDWLESTIKNAQERLANVAQMLKDRGVDIGSIEENMTKNEAKIDERLARREAIKEEQIVALEKAAIEKQTQMSTVGKVDYTEYTTERKAENSDMFIGDDAMFSAKRSYDQEVQDQLFAEATEHDTVESFIAAQGDAHYHGTLADFEVFDHKQKGSNTEAADTSWGFFFLKGDDKSYIPDFIEKTRPKGDEREMKIKEVYLSVANPIDLRQSAVFSNEDQAPLLYEIMTGEKITDSKEALEWIDENIGIAEIMEFEDLLFNDPEYLDLIKEAGYDGVVSDFGKGVSEYVAFEPFQIKTREQLETIYALAHAPQYKRTWHGSGAEFTQPSTDFVNTGEGNQAFGWGFYSADTETVSTVYRDVEKTKKTAKPGTYTKGDRTIDTSQESAQAELLQEYFTVGETVPSWGGKTDRVIALDMNPAVGLFEVTVESYNKDTKQYEGRRTHSTYPNQKNIDFIMQFRGWNRENSAAYLYELEIEDAAIETMLLWDEPMANQSAEIRRFAAEALQQSDSRLNPEGSSTGGEFYRVASTIFGGQEGASKAMLEYGIKGVKYADGFTRNQEEQTFNYVVFDTNDVTVISRNGERMMLEETPLYARVKTVPIRDTETGKFLGSYSQTVPDLSETETMMNNLVSSRATERRVNRKGRVSEYNPIKAANIDRKQGRDAALEYQYKMTAAMPGEITERLADYKRRFKLDFSVEFVDTIFTGEQELVHGRIDLVRAYGVSYNKGMAFPTFSTKTTPDHEMIHLVLRNLVGKIDPFMEFNMDALLKTANGGVMPKTAGQRVAAEEKIAVGFEGYVARREMGQTTMMGRFYQALYDAMVKVNAALGRDLPGLQKFYFAVATGKNKRQSIKLHANPVRAARVRFETPDGIKYLDFGAMKREKDYEDSLGRQALFNSILDQSVNQPEVINSVRKDINMFENLLAQSRDLYLKDPEEFKAADLYETVAESQDADKEMLDAMMAENIQDYMKLKSKDRARVDEILWRGDSLGKEFSDQEIIQMGMTTQQQKAYKGVRYALDVAHEMLLQEMRGKGMEEAEIDAFRQERKGYMPHKWKYPYVVKHQKMNEGGGYQTYLMESFKTEKLAQERSQQLADESQDALTRFEIDKLQSLEVDFFGSQELTSERMIPVIENMKEKGFIRDDVSRILRNQLVDMFKEKGFGRHYLRRTGVGGYDTNRTPEVIANYFSGFSGYISKMRHSTAYFDALSKIDARRQPEFFAWQRDAIIYKLNNKPEDIYIPIPTGKDQTMSISMRGMTFAYFLANDLSYLATNATQNFIVGLGEMSKYYEGAGKIAGPEKDLVKAMFDYSSGRISAHERMVIDEMLKKGHLGAEMSAELTGFKNNPVYSEISSRFSKLLFKSTAIVEQNINRIPAFLAMYRHFKAQGMTNAEAQRKSKEVSDDIHFRYGRQHRPRAFRGRLAVVFVFQHYIRSFLFQLYRDASRGEFVALTRKMAYTSVIGGVTALPFAKLMIEIFRKLVGDDRDEEEIMRELDTWEIALTRGIPAAYTGIDLSSRVGIGLMTVDSILDNPSDVRSYIGATGSLLFKRLPQGIDMLGQQRYADAAGKLLPDVFANPIKAVTGYIWGVRSSSGNPLLDANGDPYKYNTWEALIRATGYTPTQEAILWDQRVQTWKAQDNITAGRTDVRRTIQGMVGRGDIEAARELQATSQESGIISENTDYVKEFREDDLMANAVAQFEASDKGRGAISQIEDELIDELYNGKVTDLQRNNVRKELAVYRQYGLNNEYVDDIMRLRSNADKVQFLTELEAEIGEEAFQEFYKLGRRKIRTEAGSMVPIFFSDNLNKELRKAN